MTELYKVYHDELVWTGRHMEIICIDGKAMCGTIQDNGRNPDVVSAYFPSTGMTLAAEACEEKQQ